MKMFNMIDVGERAGSGISNIFYVRKSNVGVIRKLRSLLNLNGYPYRKTGDKKATIKRRRYGKQNSFKACRGGETY